MKKPNSCFVFEGSSHNLTVEDDELRRMRWSAIGSKKKLMRRLKEAQWLSIDPYTSLSLKGLGFTCNTRIYLAAGEAYWNGSTPRQYFTDDFQNMFTHSTLSKVEELKPSRDHQNMLAGLDFVVALESDVLVHTFVEWTF